MMQVAPQIILLGEQLQEFQVVGAATAKLLEPKHVWTLFFHLYRARAVTRHFGDYNR